MCIYTHILVKLSTWCFQRSGDISCSLLVNLSYTDESWEGRNTCLFQKTKNPVEHLNLLVDRFMSVGKSRDSLDLRFATEENKARFTFGKSNLRQIIEKWFLRFF